jgi:hypothetical protein
MSLQLIPENCWGNISSFLTLKDQRTLLDVNHKIGAVISKKIVMELPRILKAFEGIITFWPPNKKISQIASRESLRKIKNIIHSYFPEYKDLLNEFPITEQKIKNLYDPKEHPDKTYQIYTPPYVPNFDYGPYQEKIEKLYYNNTETSVLFEWSRSEYRYRPIQGIALAKKKDGSFHPIYFRLAPKELWQFTLSALDLLNDQELGHASFYPFLKENNYIQNAWNPKPSHMIGYGSNPKEINKIYVQDLQNSSKMSNWTNIGVLLLKCMMQTFPECENRIVLDSCWDSGSFYHRLGFRILGMHAQFLNAVFAKRAKTRDYEKEYNDFGRNTMYLPDEARNLWSQEINRNPIGFSCSEPQSVFPIELVGSFFRKFTGFLKAILSNDSSNELS